MRWNLDQLQAFVTTVEKGSFSSAARSLGKAQSGISTAISNLETDIGFELFNRQHRYPTLTEKGKSLYPQAYNLLKQCSHLDSRINTLLNNRESSITLAIDEVFPEQVLEQTLFEAQKSFPHLKLTLINGSQGDILDYVQQKQADIGLLVQNMPVSDEMHALNIGQLNYLIACAESHPLAQRDDLSIFDLQQFRQYVNCNKQGQTYNTPLSADYWLIDSYFYIIPLVMQGGGWAIIPQSIAQHTMFNFGLKTLNIKELNGIETSTISLIQRRDAPKPPFRMWLEDSLKLSLKQ